MRDERDEADRAAERRGAPVRERYSPPKILTSQAFERLALGCNGQADDIEPIPKPGFTQCTTVGAS